MTVAEVRLLFRTLTDEADLTFVTEAKLTVLLQTAYAEFRRLVCTYDTAFFEVSYNVVAPNAKSLSLDGTLLGPTATQPRAVKLARILALDAPGGNPVRLLRAADSYEALLAGQTFGNISWWLQTRTLQFSSVVSTPLQIQYVPTSTVDWLSGTYIDDLVDYHDIIALLAISNYKIMDFSPNPMHAEQLAKRLQDLKAYLSAGRSGDAARYVSEEGQEGGWY